MRRFSDEFMFELTQNGSIAINTKQNIHHVLSLIESRKLYLKNLLIVI